MKYCWRITKYDPKHRDIHGVYKNDEWCIYSEIGKTFNNVCFDFDEYQRIENLYMKAIGLIMACNGVSSLEVTMLEKNKKFTKDVHNNAHMVELFHNVKEGDWVTGVDLENFCKLVLRDKLWCKLRHPRKMFVHFGWDFYMYIGSANSCGEAIAKIEKNGLFVEVFKSPYE